MANEDLRLLYLAADKTPVSAADLEAIILRAFAAHFCGEMPDDNARDILEYTTNCLAQICVNEARRETDDEQQLDEITTVLQGDRAEKFYADRAAQLFVEAGDDELYANEIASWPDVLPRGALWRPYMLEKLAKIEVGHDLLVRDYMTAMAKRNQKEKHGSV